MKCGEVTSQYYPSEMLMNALTKVSGNSGQAVYGVAKDTEGKEYRKRLGTVQELIKYIS